jgi:hypothetical protein
MTMRRLEPDLGKIYGRIQYVDRFPHYRVEVVDSMEDLAVQEVASLPNGPGLWQVVDQFPDYRIQIVEASGDFKIRFVNSFPGPK